MRPWQGLTFVHWFMHNSRERLRQRNQCIEGGNHVQTVVAQDE